MVRSQSFYLSDLSTPLGPCGTEREQRQHTLFPVGASS